MTVITGTAGNDVLDTGAPSSARNDKFPQPTPAYANAGDELYGGDGDDTLTAYYNSNGDIIDGGAGNDTITVGFAGYIYSTVAATSYVAIDGPPVTVHGGYGNDRIMVATHAIVDGGDGDDTIVVGPGIQDSFTHRIIYSAPAGVDVTYRITGGGGADTFALANALGPVVITDFVHGTDKIDLTLQGAIGGFPYTTNTYYLGQQGTDAVIYRSNTNAVVAYLLDVDSSRLDPSDFVNRQPVPADTRAGTISFAGAFTVTGTAGNDIIVGGPADDLLTGGGGADTLTGGNGADTFRYVAWSDSSSGAPDRITDFQTGIDKIDISTLAPARVIVIRNIGSGASIVEANDGSGQTLAISSPYAVSLGDIVDGGAAQHQIYLRGAGTTTLTDYDLLGHATFANVYDPQGALLRQTSYTTAGAVAMDIAVNPFDKNQFTQTTYRADGTIDWKNFFYKGALVEQDGYNAAGTKVLATVHAYGSTLATTTGYADDGHMMWRNSYDGTRLTEQTGFDTAGRPSVDTVFAADGSTVRDTYAGGVRVTQAGYAVDGHLVWQNSLSNGTVTQQVGYNDAGTIATTRIAYGADGTTTTTHYDAATGALSDSLVRNAAGTAYTQTGGVGGQMLGGGAAATTYLYGSADESSVASYDILTGFRSGTDHVDLSRLATGDVTVQDNHNGWASILFAAGGIQGDIAVHGTVTANDVLLGAGAHVIFT